MLAATTALPITQFDFGIQRKLKIALIGTGIRGITFWGKRLVDEYSDILEFVGLCDINPGRLAYGKTYIGATCPTFTDFEKMVEIHKPDLVIVTTKDSNSSRIYYKGIGNGMRCTY